MIDQKNNEIKRKDRGDETCYAGYFKSDANHEYRHDHRQRFMQKPSRTGC